MPNDQVVSRQGLQTLLQACQKDFQTGLVEFCGLADRHFALVFVRGQVINAYQREARIRQFPVTEWEKIIPGLPASFQVNSLSLTPQTIRMVKIYIEQLGQGGVREARTDDLESHMRELGSGYLPCLLHLRWPSAEALVILPGSGDPPRHLMFVAERQVLHSAGGMMALYGWKEASCKITCYRSDTKIPAWREYLLHYAFIWSITYILARFEELTGRLLLNSIVREMNFSAAAHGWSINLASNTITDQSVFSSPQEAAQVYQRMFAIVTRNVESVIGREMYEVLLRESAMRLPLPYRDELRLLLPAEPDR